MLPIDKFKAFIEQHQLFNADERILLAVSGGKDSALMVHLFKKAGFNFGIAHCNFNLRGAESQRDEDFVRLLADEMGVQFHNIQFDTSVFAAQENISIQMAARQLRYQWFEELRLANDYHYIALAQHQNDSIETLLLNLVRGTGIAGMHGILPKRAKLIRPTLFLSRNDVETIVDEGNISYVEDSSNASSKYARNKIRLKVVPHLKEINPNLEETFVENIKRFSETEQLVQQIVKEKAGALLTVVGDTFEMQIADVLALYPQKLLFYEILKPFGFTSTVVDEIIASLNKQSGTGFSSQTHQLTIDRERLIISVNGSESGAPVYVHEPSIYNLSSGKNLQLTVTNELGFTSNKNKAYIDADLLRFPLIVRYWEAGDKFKPLGMQNFKNISDFFVDSKVPVPHKNKIPLVINGDGNLIWVVGMRQDERFKVTATTKKVAIFEVLNG
jgi:tRNA(Ile)-lysidine synthase